MITYQLDGAALFEAIEKRKTRMGIRTMTEAGRVMGVYPSSLYTMRQRKSPPTTEILLRILVFLGTTDLAPFLVKAKTREAA